MNPPSPTDCVPIPDMIASSAVDAFAAIVRRYQSAVCAVACATAGDPQLGEDVAQETFVVAWQSQDRLRDPSRLGPWLCGIARNRGLTARARLARAPVPTANADLVAAESDLDDAINDAAIEQLVWRALERLPARYREPLVLFYREGESVAAVAELLGENEATVRQRLSRGRERLREAMHGRLEGVLRRTIPGAAFTAAIMAALPSASAQPVASTGTSGVIAWTGWAIAAVMTASAAALAWWVTAARTEAASDDAAGAMASAATRREGADSPAWRTAPHGDTAAETSATPAIARPAVTLVVTDLLGGSIEGARVIDEHGTPLGTTDDAGIVAFAVPPAARFAAPLRLHAEGYAIGFVQPAGAGRVEVELAPQSTLRGHVVDEHGLPIAGATIDHRNRQYDRRSVASAADGSFDIDQLPAGALHLAISAPAHVRRVAIVSIGAVAAMDGGRYVLRRAASIHGHVTGELPRDLEAFVSPAEIGGPPTYDGEVPATMRDHMVTFRAGGHLEPVAVDEDGDFVLSHLPPGEWEVHLQSRYTQLADNLSQIVRLDRSDAELEIHLAKSVHFTIEAHDDDGRPLADTALLWNLAGEDVSQGCTTDLRGRCEAAAVGGRIDYARIGNRTHAGLDIPVRDGIVVRFSGPRRVPTTASITGTVVDGAGVPLPSRVLHVKVADPSAPGDWPPAFTVFTDADGRFVAHELPAGRAHVLALPATRAVGESLSLIEPLLEMGRIIPLAETTVALAEGDTVDVAMRLEGRAFDLRGVVVDDGGSPVAEALVTCGTQSTSISTSRTEPTPIDAAISDSRGAFMCTGALDTEQHTVTVIAPGGATGSVADVTSTTADVRVVVAEG